jgi:hypothetical protein
MADPLYRLRWSDEVAKRLALDDARLLRDRTGLLLPVTRVTRPGGRGIGPGPLAGLPRLVSEARFVWPMLGPANVLSAGLTALHERRARREENALRELVIEGIAAIAGEPRRRFDARLDGMARTLAIASTSAFAVAAHVRELMRCPDGFSRAIECPPLDPEMSFDAAAVALRGEVERIADVEQRAAGYAIAEVIESVSRQERGKEASDELRSRLGDLAMLVVPKLRAQAAAVTDAEARLGSALMLANALATLGTGRAVANDTSAASAFSTGVAAAREALRALLSEEGPALELFAVRLPGAKLLIAAMHALRVSELCVTNGVTTNVFEPREWLEPDALTGIPGRMSLDVLDARELVFPLDPDADDEAIAVRRWDWVIDVPSKLACRIAWSDVGSGDTVTIPFTTLLSWTGVGDALLPDGGLAQSELATVLPVLFQLADPAARSVERTLALDAAGLQPITAADRARLRAAAFGYCEHEGLLPLEARDVDALSDRALLSIIERERLTEMARDSGEPVPSVMMPREARAAARTPDADAIISDLTAALEHASEDRDRALTSLHEAKTALRLTVQRVEATSYALGLRERDRETREMLDALAAEITEAMRRIS